MITDEPVNRRTGTYTTAARSRRRLALAAGAVELAAAVGAAGLLTGDLTLGRQVTERLPWESSVLAGSALALCVALPFAALANRSWDGRRNVDALCRGAALALAGWIALQLLVIRAFSPFQPVCLLVAYLFWRAGNASRRGLRGRGQLAPPPGRAPVSEVRPSVLQLFGGAAPGEAAPPSRSRPGRRMGPFGPARSGPRPLGPGIPITEDRDQATEEAPPY
jgi:hypothetical protein